MNAIDSNIQKKIPHESLELTTMQSREMEELLPTLNLHKIDMPILEWSLSTELNVINGNSIPVSILEKHNANSDTINVNKHHSAKIVERNNNEIFTQINLIPLETEDKDYKSKKKTKINPLFDLNQTSQGSKNEISSSQNDDIELVQGLKYSQDGLLLDDEMSSFNTQKVSVQYKGLEDIAGLEDVKQHLREAVIYPMKYPQLFTNGRSIWSRMLLYGAPGVGKTAIVHALAAEAKIQLFQVSSADIISAWHGQSEKLVRQLFYSLGNKRCLLFFDEVDSLCRKMTSTDSNNCRRVATELLIQMQNYENSAMFLICATNCPWEIDPAFLRRFQCSIYVPLPDMQAREKLILSLIDNKELADDKGWLKFIQSTDGLTGSDLKNLVRSAMMIPLREIHVSSYWIQIDNGMIMPADKQNPKAFKCSHESIPNSKMWCRKLLMNDLWTGLKKAEKTVTNQDIKQFDNFRIEHST